MPSDLPSPEHQYRRHALLVLIGCVLATSLITLAAQGATLTPLEHVGLTLIALKNATLFLWLWRRPDHLQAVGVTEFTLEIVLSLGRLAQTLLVDHTSYGLGGYSYWLTIGPLVGSLVLTPRAFLLAASGYYAVMVSLAAAYWWSPDIAPATKAASSNLLLQLLLVNGTVIALLSLQHRLRLQYGRALLSAEQVATLAQVDALTGLPNRRQLQLWLDAHVTGAGPEHLSVILFDLDHFKQVNDMHGHEVGDQVLRRVASVTVGTVRGDDRVGRWGGEEFLILVAGGSDVAQAVARRVQLTLHALQHPQAGTVTISCGIAQAQPGETPSSLLRRADGALYHAKRTGRATTHAAPA